MPNPENNNPWTRNFHQLGALNPLERIMPQLFNNEQLEDGYPALQAALREVIYDRKGAFIIWDDTTDEFSISGIYSSVSVGSGRILTKTGDRTEIVFCAATSGLNIDALNKCIVASSDGSISVKLQSAILKTDVVLALRGIDDSVIVAWKQDNPLEDGLDATVRDLYVSGSIKISNIYMVHDKAEFDDALTDIYSLASKTGWILCYPGTYDAGIDIDDAGATIRVTGFGLDSEFNFNSTTSAITVTNCRALIIENILVRATENTLLPGININDDSVLVRDSHVWGYSGSSDGIGIKATGHEDCIFERLSIAFIKEGIFLSGMGKSKILDCRFADMEAVSDHLLIPIKLVSTTETTVHGNIIHDISPTTTSVCYPIYLESCKRCAVIGNIIYGLTNLSSSWTIYLGTDSDESTVNGNVIRDINATDVTGIRFSATANRNAVVGNTIYDIAGTTVYSIYVQGAHNVASSNYADGLISVTGTTNVVTGNNTNGNYVSNPGGSTNVIGYNEGHIVGAASEGVSSDVTGTYTLKVSLVIPFPGRWQVNWSCEAYNTTDADDVYVRLQDVTNVVTYAEVQNPNAGAAGSENKDYGSMGGIVTIIATASLTLEIQFRQNGGGTANIRRARIVAQTL